MYLNFIFLLIIILISLLFTNFENIENFEVTTNPTYTQTPFSDVTTSPQTPFSTNTPLPPYERMPEPVTDIDPVNNIVVISKAEKDEVKNQDSSLFDVAIPMFPPPTSPAPKPENCSYSWDEWSKCNVDNGYIFRNVHTVPPKNNGTACTSPPIKNTEKTCLDNIQFLNKFSGWNIIYRPTDLQNIGNIKVAVGRESVNNLGFNYTETTTISPPPTNTPNNTATPDSTYKPTKNANNWQLSRNKPYAYIGFDNRNGEFTKYSSPSITLQTNITLDPGNYAMFYYIQDLINQDGNQAINVFSSVNSYTNTSYKFTKSGVWISQVLLFNITEDESEQPANIQFNFVLKTNRTGTNNTVALSGIHFISCGDNPCPIDCEFFWNEWSSCNTSNGTITRSPNIMIKSYNGGKECPATEINKCTVDCSYSWNDWSSCDTKTGTVYRDPKIIIQPLNNGKECPKREINNCTVDCSYSWNPWSVCDPSGYQYREIKQNYPPLNNGATCPPKQRQDCNFDCCYNWPTYGPCDLKTGTKYRDPIIKYPPVNNGLKCPSKDITTCPVDCSYVWDKWSICDKETGTQFRDPIVSVQTKNNGISCPPREIQKCAVDCSYTWNNWSACNKDTGKKYRDPKIYAQPKNGGAACPGQDSQDCTVDCSYTWSNWSVCDKKTGTQYRDPVISINPKNNGAACPGRQTQNCDVNCEGSWGDWSACNKDTGKQYRDWKVTVPQKNKGTACPSQQSQNCVVNCEGNWGNWGACNKDTGIQYRDWNVTVTAKNGGTACPSQQSQNCDVNCEGGWGGWSACDKGSGTQYRDWNVTVQKKNNGAACPGRQTQNCDVNCEGGWSGWSNCSASCGGGTQTSKYTITQPYKNNGTKCSNKTGDIQSQSCNKTACNVISSDNYGGQGGGNIFDKPCDGNSYLKAFTGRSGYWLDAIGGFCEGDKESSFGVYGGSGGGASKWPQCNDGGKMQSVIVSKTNNDTHGVGGVVGGVQGVCRDGSKPSVGNMNWGNKTTFTCPNGYFVSGLKGRYGDAVDSLGIYCKQDQ